jgi:3-dehydrosphinganine reductase
MASNGKGTSILSMFSGKTILITGGSSGIGLATASQLASQGAHLWLLARRQEPLIQAQALVAAQRANSDQQVEILTANVADPKQVQQAVELMTQQAGTPDILINAAGITFPGYLENLELETIQELMDINYLGVVNCTKAVLPGMLRRGSGSIVNLASMAAIISLPGYTAYGASKYAVRGFSESLHTELKRKGIHVAVVYPPDTDTPQLKNELPLRPAEVNVIASLDSVMPPEEVAEAIIKGIRKKQFLIIPGFGNQFFFWLHSLLGSLAYPLMDQIVAWAVRKNHHPSTEQRD